MRVKVFISVFLFFAIFVAIPPAPANANILDDIVAKLRSVVEDKVSKKGHNKILVEANITLVSEGDLNKNGQIDTGDTVKFLYNITNDTDFEYKFAKLETNVNPKQIHHITKMSGATGIRDDDKSVVIQNLLINPRQQHTVEFLADINFNEANDKPISTEAVLWSEDKKLLSRSSKKKVTAKKLNSKDRKFLPKSVKWKKKTVMQQ